MTHPLVAAEFATIPWALMPERLNAYARILRRREAGLPVARGDNQPRQRVSAWDARKAPSQKAQAQKHATGGIAVLPLYGTIMQRANMMTDFCGGTSTQQFTQAFRDALADNTIGSILIDIDSPGGSVYGVGELADEIYQARGKKSIVAYSNSLAASAAYWVGAACSEFYVTPGGEVGSIGVWMAHEDYSKAMDEQGVATTLISAGEFKTEGNPYQPLPDDAKAFMQSRVDDYYNAFTKGVAKGRGVGIGAVRGGMGQGRVLGADAALAEKMVDGIATLDEVVKKMQKNITQTRVGASRLAQAQNELKILG